MQHNSKLRYLAIAVLVLVLASASAWAKPISLIVGGKAIFLHTAPVLDDGEVYIPLPALRAIGASAKEDGDARDDEQKMEIKPASGDRFDCKARIIDGNPMLPIMDIAEELGAVTQWDKERNSLSIRAKLDEVKFDGTKLRIKTSFPVSYEIVQSSWTVAERKFILDVPGVHLPRSADDKVENDTKIPIRLGTKEDGETMRVVLDLPFSIKARKDSAARTREITISVSPSLKDAPAPDRTITPPQSTTGPTRPTIRPSVPAKPAEISGVDYHDRGSKRIDISIDADAPVKYETSMLRDPDRLVIELANSKMAMDSMDKDISHSIATGLRVSQYSSDTVRVVLDLTRPAAFDIEQERSGKLTVSLELPRGAGGSLVGKTIVIDPGHGGGAPGAQANGCREKDLNLAVAMRVESLLKQAGAIVLMTRKTDKDVSLDERPSFANRHSADLFVSIHHNAMGSANKMSGTETFYHGSDASSRVLAQCIQSEVTAANGLPSLGVKSDLKRYPNGGFAVLRGARMPAVLLEVAFLDHSGDAACARDSEFQQKVAAALVRGLKTYIEGSPRTESRRPLKVENTKDEKPQNRMSASEPKETPKSEPKEAPKAEPKEASKSDAGDESRSSNSIIPKGRVK